MSTHVELLPAVVSSFASSDVPEISVHVGQESSWAHRVSQIVLILGLLLGAAPSDAAPPLFPGATSSYRAWVAAELPGSPEGLAMDADGRLYAGIFRTGQIVRLDGKGGYDVIATIPDPVLGKQGVTIGMEFDKKGDLYVAFLWNYTESDQQDTLHTACHDSRDIHTGIYRVHLDNGSVVPFLTKKSGWPGCLPDDIAFDHAGNMYVTDLTLGVLWKVTADGSYSKWSDDPLIQVPPTPLAAFPLGPNALVLANEGDALYVGTVGNPMVARIPINNDGSSGVGTVFARYIGSNDGIDIDEMGNVYVSEPQLNTITVFSPKGDKRMVIATRETAPLAGPTSLVVHKQVVCTSNVDFDAAPAMQAERGTVTCISGFRLPQ